MKTEHQVIAAVVVLLALGGIFYATRDSAKADRESRSASATQSDLPSITIPNEDADKITKLEFKNADKEKIVLEKKGDAWEITAPIQAKANKNDVKTLLDGLKDLKTTDVIDRTTAGYARYDLADGKGLNFVVYKGADKALDVTFGASGTRGQMVRVAGKDGIWVAQGYQSYLYTKEVKNWRDKTVMEFEDVNVASVEIENEHGKYVFTKAGDNWSGTFTASGKPKKKDEKKKDEKKKDDAGKDEKKDGEKKDEKKPEAKKEGDRSKPGGWEKFDGKKVEDMLRAFKKLNAIDFADAGDDTGLDAATEHGGVVKITFKDGKTITLHVGKKQKGTNRFAKHDEADTIWVISDWSAKWAVAEPKEFEKKDDKKEAGKDDGHGHGDHETPDLDLEMPTE